MNELYPARTNQKLSFVRLHLEALERAQQSSSWDKHGLIESYNESVLFHLKGALNAFVREIGERYRLDVVNVDSPAQLQRQLEQTGQESPELNELMLLAERQDSWLGRLERAYAACWSASDRRKGAGSERSLSEIHVMQINPDHAEDGELLTELRQWFAALEELVERLRGTLQEW